MAFQVTGFALLAAFYACYFRKMHLQRKQGIKTNQLGRGKSGPGKWLELAVSAGNWAAAAGMVWAIVSDGPGLPVWARLTGAVLSAAGVLMFALAVADMGDSWRAGVPVSEEPALVTDGIYRISRNPAFLGFDLLYLGMALLFFTPPSALLSAAAAGLLHGQVLLVEEPFLRKRFGPAYEAYSRRVNRYFGRKR